MTKRDNILAELRELNSSLVNAGSQNLYQVPVGYFDSLIEQVMNRIKTLNEESAVEELNELSPLLSGIFKQMPYAVPVGFFDGIAENVIASVKNNHQTPTEELEMLSPLISGISKQMPYAVPAGYFDGITENVIALAKNNHQTPAEELETLSPLLSGLKKEMPYSVPQGYFDTVVPAIPSETKVISITRKSWFRYAAAAVVIGIVAISGFLIFNKKDTIDPVTKSSEWVSKNMKKVSTDEINKFVELTDEESPVVAITNASNEMKDKNEIKDLIKDVSDKDIQNFLDETQTDEPAANDDALMN
jgi:hypothetical protein